jgi:hypothetical protein
MMERWKNAKDCEETIRMVREMRAEANKSNLNLRLIEDLAIAAAFAAYIVMLLSKHSRAELIGWAPDRDKITEAYAGAVSAFFSINVSVLSVNRRLRLPSLGIFTQGNEDLWCDPYIRLADYVAGAAAAWDPPVVNNVHPKIAEVFADNPFVVLLRVAFRATNGQGRCEINHMAVSYNPPGRPLQGKLRFPSTFPLRGRSKDLWRE